MLKQLKIDNFTLFPEADLQFASGLNVIVGENGCGKSHLLKLLYAISFENTSQEKKPNVQEANKEILEHHYAEKIRNVFHSSSIEKLARLEKSINSSHAFNGFGCTCFPLTIELNYNDEELNTVFQYDYKIQYDDEGEPLSAEPTFNILTVPKKWDKIKPVFIPTKELITIYPGFIILYDNYHTEFDETYRDTCELLGFLALKGKREEQAKEMLKPLEEAMGGKIILDNGRFYLSTQNKGKIEMPMVAEGQRKLAMLARLIATGTLLDNGYLFWDEPESNLNPKLIKVIAKVILHLCNSGIQVFIASHSLFLLRELEILSEYDEFKEVKTRYFSLCLEYDEVTVEQGNSIEDLQTLVLLDEELLQSDRYMKLGS